MLTFLSAAPPWPPEPEPLEPPNELLSPLHAVMAVMSRARSPASSDALRLRVERAIVDDSLSGRRESGLVGGGVGGGRGGFGDVLSALGPTPAGFGECGGEAVEVD